MNAPQPAYRPPTAYVHGVEGPVVLVPARVAAWLDRRAKLTDLRGEHRGADAEVDNVLLALRLAAMSWRRTATGTDTPEAPEPETPSQWLTTTDVATAAGITGRGVRKAIAAGRLHASQVNGRWLVTREDLEHYRAARRAA